MNRNDIEVYTVAEIELDEGRLIQARWHGGGIVNVYVDGKEVDVFTNYSIRTPDDLAKSFEEYLDYEQELANEQ